MPCGKDTNPGRGCACVAEDRRAERVYRSSPTCPMRRRIPITLRTGVIACMRGATTGGSTPIRVFPPHVRLPRAETVGGRRVHVSQPRRNDSGEDVRSATTGRSLPRTACRPKGAAADREGIEFHRRRYRTASKYLVYFQSFSNTYAPLERLKEVYGEALAHPDVAGSSSARARLRGRRKAGLFRGAGAREVRGRRIRHRIDRDETLRAVNRGHDFACARRAVEMTAARGLHVGAHFILGLPGETTRCCWSRSRRSIRCRSRR